LNNGVIHVGSHRGEEVPGYLSERRSPIICFEPQELGWYPPVGVQLVRCALSDVSGSMTLRIPHHLHQTPERDTQSASGLMLIAERAIANGWTPTPCDFRSVNTIRFDEWAQSSGFDNESCSTLVIDVQGMELQVLKGFGHYLEGFSMIVAECSEPALYEGGAAASEVIWFLKSHGFQQTSPVIQHGDIIFEREERD
jgi:FkbM family methyltransferase